MAEPATASEVATDTRADLPGELGRFVVLHRLGTGGMGVVYAAYDPELDRKVAVKLLHPNLTGSELEELGRARLQREALAMAKLSHPNVVAVFDVGTYQDQVFIAMEFVQGLPLSTWLGTSRARRDIITVFLAAGRGLAAAHRQGIVHGDFKPDNVIVDADCRARVLDFGLAFAQDRGERETTDLERKPSRSGRSAVDLNTRLTRTGAVTGTPPYLSPEQFLGDPASALTDQYAFCVSLYEGLYGQRPFHGESLGSLRQQVLLATVPDEPRERRLPGWLRRLLLRGLARDPADRFPNMDALLAELARDPTRRRRRIALALAGLALLAGGAIGYRWYLLRSLDQARSVGQSLCRGAADNLVGVWDTTRREQVAAAIRATHVTYADDVWDRVARQLDAYTAAWVHMHGDACQATYLRGEQSPALLDRRMACLQRAHTELRTLVDVLARADAGVVEHATEASAGLPPLARCADIPALLAERPPPAAEQAAAIRDVRDRLAMAAALERTMQLAAGLAIAGPALAQAAALGDPELHAEAHLQHGSLLQHTGEHLSAERAFADAFFTAEASRSDAIAARAATELIRGTMQHSTPAAHQWVRHARAQIARLAQDGAGEARRREADLLSAIGLLQIHDGDHAQAEQTLAHAIDLRQHLADPEPLKQAALHNNLGNLRVRRGDLDGAQQQLDLASAIYRTQLGERHPSVGIALNNLGELHSRRGELAQSERAYKQAHAILLAGLGPQHPNVGTILNNLGDTLLRQGQFAAAEEHYTRALAIFVASFGEDAQPLAYPLTGLGEALLAQRRLAEALTRLERALTLRDAGSPTDLARTRFALARALWADPAARARAHGLAELARDELRAAGKAATRELGEVEAWLASRPAPPVAAR